MLIRRHLILGLLAVSGAASVTTGYAQGIDEIGGLPELARVFIEKQMDIWAKAVKDNNTRAG